jgi:AraC-like DNA-binding protein
MHAVNGSDIVTRRLLAENSVGLIESLHVLGPRAAPPRQESFGADFQVCLPYRGAFCWHVGRDEVVADANQVLFVAGGEGYRMSRPIDGGYAELIVTVLPSLLAETLGVSERHVAAHTLFRRRCRVAEKRLQWLGARGLHGSRHGWDGLASEEWLVAFLRVSLAVRTDARSASPSTLRSLARAKEYLTANLASPVRLSHVSKAARTSPAYLTTLFTRVEGVSLHRYLVQLRLARSLAELPHASDITRLASDLGFSTHSHFTSSFRRAFGCTPSTYRDSIRRERAAIRLRGRTAERSRQRSPLAADTY